MSKKKMNQGRRPAASQAESADKPATLKDLLNADIVSKLKSQAEEMRAEEARQKADQRKREEEARKAEQKRLESSFEYLLNNSSMDWRKHKS
ncbi:YqkE family protein [Gorillibacterium sp. sgz5001074]|uniref:YqkE family protein n=1 Tax=Gorillibacterium sp. sgz5001074 TaxID=3446695 RepID=UPI003F677A70